jgi:hypothetical protein
VNMDKVTGKVQQKLFLSNVFWFCEPNHYYHSSLPFFCRRPMTNIFPKAGINALISASTLTK